MKHRIKFCGAQNSSGALHQSGVAEFSLPTDVDGDLYHKVKHNLNRNTARSVLVTYLVNKPDCMSRV